MHIVKMMWWNHHKNAISTTKMGDLWWVHHIISLREYVGVHHKKGHFHHKEGHFVVEMGDLWWVHHIIFTM